MAQTAEGKQKHRETMIKKYGTYENFKQAMREFGSEGGKAARDSGNLKYPFRDKELAKLAGAKGGRISRRNRGV